METSVPVYGSTAQTFTELPMAENSKITSSRAESVRLRFARKVRPEGRTGMV